MNTKELGFLAENLASRYLENANYQVLAKNYRKPWGEIDIIVKKDEVVVFVEVKANSQEFKGDFNPEVRVDRVKLSKITKTAMLYLEYELKKPESEWRVDIVSVIFDKPSQKAKIKHFKNVAEAAF